MKYEAKLHIEDGTYPNGDKFRSVYYGHTRIGIYSVTNEGYLPAGARKVLQTEREAQIKVLKSRLAEYRAGEALMLELLEELNNATKSE